MSQRTVQRITAAGALTLLLVLAGPARAEAREPGRGVWRWLTAFWEDGASILRTGTGETDRRSTTKQGLGIDPDGQTNPGPSGSTGQSCGAACEQGFGLDPNG
jgi:hypothetical protein